ncbi:MAG: phosphoribosyltransferase family protein [Marinoscillum sp.]|uniref:ComF family protein n=1 Tax=Marinoscillum sp. TaxID=2024838 RepID=UPI0032F26560
MTIQEFKDNLLGRESIKLYTVGQYYYCEPLPVKVNINKDISTPDWKHKASFKVVQYHDEYVITKNGDVNCYGLEIPGIWSGGFSMDFHTTKSEPAETDSEGNVLSWHTMRPPIGEELYRLKYWREKYRAEIIAIPTCDLIREKNASWKIDVIIPMPPSDLDRAFQPVYEIAHHISHKLGIPLDLDYLRKAKSTSQLKSIMDPTKRKELLKDAFSVASDKYKQKSVLLFDDLYRSGSTVTEATRILLNSGNVDKVYVVTITKTRSKR